ncbi:MAG TPA: hypothetical protein VIJ65_05590 [Acidobacteriaceae bacterium]
MQNDKPFRFRIHSRALATAGLSAALLFAAGCHHNAAASGQDAANGAQDPATANLAPVNGQTQVLDQNSSYAPQQQGESYPQGQQAPAPIVQGTPQYAQPAYQAGYDQNPDAEQAGEEAIEETDQAPPPLPEYDQPPAPGPDYMWTPGYWAWGPEGYYWVPGAWVEAPYYGALWTPPYWGWYGGHYRFHHGYWGPHVGYYGGIDYGFGYIGIGYFGGYWNRDHFYYNRAVTHVGGGIHDYYDRPVVYNNRRYEGRPSNRVSYNGGRGGINRAPQPEELAAGREHHVAALPAQRQVRTSAGQNRSQFFNQNHGRPASAVETRGFANPRGIAPTPRDVQPGRPNVEPGRTNVQPGRPGVEPGRTNVQPGRPNVEPGRPNVQPERPGNVAPNTGVPNREPNGVNGTRRGANPGVNPRMNPGNARPVQPNQPQPGRTEQQQQRMQTPQNRPVPQQQQRMQTPQNRPVPQQRMQAPRPAPQQRMQAPQPQSRPAPQQRMQAPQPQSRPAPQQRMQAPPRPAPQQRMEAPRPAPQQRMQAPRPAPQQRTQAPRPAPQGHPAPQSHGGGNDHPQGNGHGH